MIKQDNRQDLRDWLPTTKKEVKLRGWEQLDVILFSGDAYIDHPSFGIAIIGRILENFGLRVAIIPQPNWQDDLRDFKKLGEPRLFFGVSSGNMDSMVNHYTANRRLRSNDAYTAGDKAGFRPDYATTTYSNILKSIYPNTPIILGGIEASLRRLTHYDYWSDSLKPGILEDSKADLLVYGMGEEAIIDIARAMQNGKKIDELTDIKQTAYINRSNDKYQTTANNEKVIYLHSHEECLTSKTKFAKNFVIIEEESNKITPSTLIQKLKDKHIVINPPYPTLSEKTFDAIYDLPFTRLPHPKYNKKEAIPAFNMIKFSVNIHRGCFGGCSFCTISAHQGKFISSRSEKSILKEISQICNAPDFKGHITDLGGPSANMYKMKGINLEICAKCKKPSCLFPEICKNLNSDHKPLLNLYKAVRDLNTIKKVSIGSGIRYDLIYNCNNSKLNQNGIEYIKELIKYHVSGRLKVAPEHTSDEVLRIMRKPSFKIFQEFNKLFNNINKANNLKQQLIPYFISSHPACTEIDMAELAADTNSLNFKLEQIQDFTPTPMTLATVMYYSGLNPYTLKPIYVAKTKEAKLNQRKFFFWYKPEYKNKIKNQLQKAGKIDILKKLFGNRK